LALVALLALETITVLLVQTQCFQLLLLLVAVLVQHKEQTAQLLALVVAAVVVVILAQVAQELPTKVLQAVQQYQVLVEAQVEVVLEQQVLMLTLEEI
jgi:hypothetical protein